ncbi:hypothetical protein [Curtobacterium herbarum]|uniref:Uncharacterized protein n=1 Tax=Curtobacterium herbarum TaxID=150122 RepID=A0ABN1ZF86_9MICO|nr:hypothetical protein [Curtobacterium herbarum]MBM7474404.1 hypothetical protein [Curtobacterium herbarum]MCS6545790.1 hypothetical protein [Curtobacterium herbarum]
MKRTVLTYGGTQYTIANEDTETVQARIDAGLRDQPFMWLHVNHGDGRVTPAVLLVSPATPVAIITERDVDEQDEGDVGRYLLPEEPDSASIESSPTDH